MGEKRLDFVLAASQFKRQVDLLGPHLFGVFSDLYELSKISPNIHMMFPAQKREAFDEINEELRSGGGKNAAVMLKYLVDSKDLRLRAAFSDRYDTLDHMRAVIMHSMGKAGYDAVMNEFILNVHTRRLEMELGDDFFDFCGVSFVPQSDDERYIQLYAKTVESIYSSIVGTEYGGVEDGG